MKKFGEVLNCLIQRLRPYIPFSALNTIWRKLDKQSGSPLVGSQIAEDDPTIPTNSTARLPDFRLLAEGFSRQTDKEFIQFLHMAKGSASEVQSQLYVAFDLGYISEV